MRITKLRNGQNNITEGYLEPPNRWEYIMLYPRNKALVVSDYSGPFIDIVLDAEEHDWTFVDLAER